MPRKMMFCREPPMTPIFADKCIVIDLVQKAATPILTRGLGPVLLVLTKRYRTKQKG